MRFSNTNGVSYLWSLNKNSLEHPWFSKCVMYSIYVYIIVDIARQTLRLIVYYGKLIQSSQNESKSTSTASILVCLYNTTTDESRSNHIFQSSFAYRRHWLWVCVYNLQLQMKSAKPANAVCEVGCNICVYMTLNR